MKPYAFLLAGHSHWGKSRTLRSLTVERRPAWTRIAEVSFFIRRMSNDDWNEHYRNFITSCVEDTSSNLIVAFCPNFEIPGRYSLDTLQRISAQYRVHVFALRHQYRSNLVISDLEIQTMSRFAEVRIYDERDREAPERAIAFRNYITEVVTRL